MGRMILSSFILGSPPNFKLNAWLSYVPISTHEKIEIPNLILKGASSRFSGINGSSLELYDFYSISYYLFSLISMTKFVSEFKEDLFIETWTIGSSKYYIGCESITTFFFLSLFIQKPKKYNTFYHHIIDFDQS
jgi:hypothetical protein